jgi:hypothetical protein
MGVLFTAPTNLTRTTNLPSITSWTAMLLVQTTSSAAGTITPLFQFGDTVSDYTLKLTWASTNDTKMTLGNSSTSVQGTTVITAVAVGGYRTLTLTCEGTGAGQFLGYLDGVLEVTHSGHVNPTAPTVRISSAGAAAGGTWYLSFKFWEGVLSPAEMLLEHRQVCPRRIEGLKAFLPLFLDFTNDYSGNGAFTHSGGGGYSHWHLPASWSSGRRRLAVPMGPRATLSGNVAAGLTEAQVVSG